MSVEWDSLRDDLLPPGWAVVSMTPDEVVFRHTDLGFSVEGVCVDPEPPDAKLGIDRCWELRLRYAIGECTATDVLARASTRADLQAELGSILDAFQRRLPDISDPIDACRLLRSDDNSVP
ncbi:hypothetical protein C479_08583 [Halovivax asiaticus JCM 14624]|uniref:Uncharacterized protein n=1 Tax=Halovivax asiaticus JCM 14624 TaxID=1227490 RepID=M0BMJ9_9EURY|nr:hypothetical protein C479_08583 [Halovivax asiaticus JCM 14624]